MNSGIATAIFAAALFVAIGARAQTTNTESFNPDLAIPDGNLAGITLSGAVSNFPAGATIEELMVNLHITGGYDGSLYAYLVSPNGTMVELLDQPGVTGGNPFGNEESGMNLTLAAGGTPITASSDLASGIYAVSGTLADLNGQSPNGIWQLFIADKMTGGGTSTLNSWGLQIITAAVPEPTSAALGIFGVALLAGAIKRQARR